MESCFGISTVFKFSITNSGKYLFDLTKCQIKYHISTHIYIYFQSIVESCFGIGTVFGPGDKDDANIFIILYQKS